MFLVQKHCFKPSSVFLKWQMEMSAIRGGQIANGNFFHRSRSELQKQLEEWTADRFVNKREFEEIFDD